MTTLKEKIAEEVTSSGIDTSQLANFVWGGENIIKQYKNITTTIQNDPTTRFRVPYAEMYRDEGFYNNIKRVNRVNELADQGVVPKVDGINYGIFAIGMGTLYPTSVHHGMFETLVQTLGSDEQIKKHWDDIKAYKIIGCYAQTEMGTGSNVQGLQTTATYDETTEEFIINSPTITAAKFWPGDLGKMANYACVFAKLIIKGESYGIHSFLMRIRDDTHTPLRGIEIGDIGPKYGYHLKDNGYMIFDNVRIPRSSILSKYVSVTKEGVIELKGDPRVAYATMLYIRVTLMTLNWMVLFITLAEVFRYALKRSQFKTISNSKEERKILQYQVTQTKLVPFLAFAYANTFTDQLCYAFYNKMMERIKESDFKIMGDLHILASALKAHFMQEALDGLFVMREILGANGFSLMGAIPGWIESWSPNVTLEGDGFVLYQQTTKRLIKLLPSRTDKQIGQSRRPPVRIKDDLGSEVCRRCHCVDIGYRPRRLEIVECPSRRTTRSECVKNTLIGRETEHRQSSWIKRSCFISICPPATRKTKKASLICGTRWYTLTKLLLTSAVGICQNPN